MYISTHSTGERQRERESEEGGVVEREFPPIFDIFRATSLDKEWNPPSLARFDPFGKQRTRAG